MPSESALRAPPPVSGEDDLAPVGSEDYYIARMHPARERPRVAIHLALEARLLGLLLEGSEPSLVRLRLRWWQDCLAAACNGDYHHPLTARLGKLDAGTPGQWPAAFAQAALALEERLTWQTPRPADEILDNLHQVEGALAQALVRDLSPHTDPATLAAVRELAATTQWARGLQRLPRWQQLGLHWLPIEDLRAHAPGHGSADGVAGADHAGHAIAHWPRLADAFVGRALGLALAAHRRLPRSTRGATLAVRIRHGCARAELARCAAAGWPVLRERVTLTPIARLIIALGVSCFDHLPKGPVSPPP